MQIRVQPDEVVAAGSRLAGDGALLQALATLVEVTERGSGPATGSPALAAETARLRTAVSSALRRAGQATDAVSTGLVRGGRAYADAEDRARVMGRWRHGG